MGIFQMREMAKGGGEVKRLLAFIVLWARLQRETINQLAILPSLLRRVKPGETKKFRLQPILITVKRTVDEKAYVTIERAPDAEAEEIGE